MENAKLLGAAPNPINSAATPDVTLHPCQDLRLKLHVGLLVAEVVSEDNYAPSAARRSQGTSRFIPSYFTFLPCIESGMLLITCFG